MHITMYFIAIFIFSLFLVRPTQALNTPEERFERLSLSFESSPGSGVVELKGILEDGLRFHDQPDDVLHNFAVSVGHAGSREAMRALMGRHAVIDIDVSRRFIMTALTAAVERGQEGFFGWALSQRRSFHRTLGFYDWLILYFTAKNARQAGIVHWLREAPHESSPPGFSSFLRGESIMSTLMKVVVAGSEARHEILKLLKYLKSSEAGRALLASIPKSFAHNAWTRIMRRDLLDSAHSFRLREFSFDVNEQIDFLMVDIVRYIPMVLTQGNIDGYFTDAYELRNLAWMRFFLSGYLGMLTPSSQVLEDIRADALRMAAMENEFSEAVERAVRCAFFQEVAAAINLGHPGGRNDLPSCNATNLARQQNSLPVSLSLRVPSPLPESNGSL